MENHGELLSVSAAEFGVEVKRFRVGRRLSEDELGRMLGISGNYVYMMERGKLSPATAVLQRFTALIKAANIFAVAACPGIRERDIAVVSWAQAGRATNYEEMVEGWLDSTRSACPDREAFGIKLVGDSMEPEYRAGEIVVVMPNCVAQNGCLVVVRLLDDGVMFKRFTCCKSRPGRFKLMSFNKRYSPIELTWDQVHWVYPVFAARASVKRAPHKP